MTRRRRKGTLPAVCRAIIFPVPSPPRRSGLTPRTRIRRTVDLVDPNVFETANAGFAQAMYEEFLRDPNAVGPEWRRLFESGVVGEKNGAHAETAQAVGRDAGKRGPVRGSGEAGKPPSGASPIKGPAAKLVANMTES